MATEKYINVYYTVDPLVIKGYDGIISQLCFGVKPGNTADYNFGVNEITGHFSFKINPKLIKPSAAPTLESEAKRVVEEIVTKITEKVALNKNLPKDFPPLFDRNYLYMKSVAPVYHDTYKKITGWVALYGFRLKAADSSDANSTEKIGILENDSVILEISGTKLTSFDYNHTPIIDRKKFKVSTNDSSEIVYKKGGQGLLTPYYITSQGYIPACLQSPNIQESISTSNRRVKPINNLIGESCKSMITLSDIKEPIDGTPGSAKIVISMDYRIVTIGEGAMENVEIIDVKAFEEIYKMGNAPGSENKYTFKLKTLPSKETMVELVSDKEFRDTKKIDKVTAKPLFWDYYYVTIEYEYTLSKEAGFSLWDGMKWLAECPFSRGLFYLLPFEAEAEQVYQTLYVLTNNDIKSELTPEEKKGLTEKDFTSLLFKKRGEAMQIYNGKLTSYLLRSIISEDIAKYSNATILLKSVSEAYFDGSSSSLLDIEFHTFLNSIHSTLVAKVPEGNVPPVVELNGYTNFHISFLVPISNLTVYALKSFDKEKFESPETGGVGSNPNMSPEYATLNLVICNPKYFGKRALGKAFYFGGMTPAELLAHEAGHNAAAQFIHAEDGKGYYEYFQTGLQSNKRSQVYPTFENTIDILNDPDNRKNMTIK